MSDSKKYYYLKLKENFFDSEEIKILKSMENGYEYTCILLEMHLKSLKNEGKLIFQDTIPYDPKMLSVVLGHNIAVIEKAIDIFIRLNLIEQLRTGEIFLLNIQSFIGKSSSEADRIRIYRSSIEEEKLLKSSTNTVQMYDKRTPEKELELEKELEIKIETEKEKKRSKTFLSDSDEYRLSSYLFELIKSNNGQAKEPNKQKWSKTFDLMIRIDKRKINDIKKVIMFSQKDQFWYKNILSADKLRLHFEKLTLQMQEPKYKNNKKESPQWGLPGSEYAANNDIDDLEKKLLGWDK